MRLHNLEQNKSATDLQKLAADPMYSVYVSASAGTGKTKVLVDRFVSLMLCGVEPENILCLTFTNAAAKEMADRIKSRLLEISDTNHISLKEFLESFTNFTISDEHMVLAPKLLGKFLNVQNKLNIQTIHSLCNNILVKYHLENDLRKTVQILDTNEKANLIKQTFTAVLESSINDDALNYAISQLTDNYQLGWLEGICRQIINDKQSFLNVLNKNKTLNDIIKNIYIILRADFSLSSTDILNNYRKEKENWYNNLKKELENSNSAEIEKYLPELEVFMNIDTITIGNYKNLFLTTDGQPRKKLLKNNDKKEYPQLEAMLREEQENIISLKRNLDTQLHAEMNAAYWIFINETLKEYEKQKGETIYDYDDLLLKTLEIVQNHENADWLLYYLDFKFDHIMVDEAQDLSQIQWQLVKTIGEEFFTGVSAKAYNRTIMIVGDFKQSIYSFQGAHPKSFIEINDFFRTLAENAHKKWFNINLNTSFRTTSPILKVIDDFFNQDSIHSNFISAAQIQHQASRIGNGKAVKFPIIVKEINEKAQNNQWSFPNDTTNELSCEVILARKIADTIKNWLQNKRLLLGHNRAIEPQDILILIRKRGPIQNHLVKELKHREVEVENQQSSLLKEHLAIMDLLAIIRYFIMPTDNLNLVNLLQAPIFNFAEDKIKNLCMSRNNKTIVACLSNEHPEVYAILENYKQYFKDNGLFMFYVKLLEHDGVRQRILSRLGMHNAELLDYFLDLCLQYESSNFVDAFNFLQYIENSDCTFESAQQDLNAVRIMTVHSAKGLQAPIVIIADSASTEQMPVDVYYKYQEQIIFNSPLGISPVFEDIKKISQQERSAESLRLLYVAMTRAEDELYLCGWENKKIEKSWYSHLSPLLQEEDFSEFRGISLKDKSINDVTSLPSPPEFLRTPVDNAERSLISFITGYNDQLEEDNKTSDVKRDQYKRGEILHKLLYLAPMIAKENLPDCYNNFLQAYSKYISQIDIENVKKTFDKFPQFFYPTQGQEIFSELAVSANIGGKIYSLQIDKLIIDGSDIMIIEFKSEKNPPESMEEINKNYLTQLNLYQKAISKIYPQHEIKTFILWLTTQELMVINN